MIFTCSCVVCGPRESQIWVESLADILLLLMGCVVNTKIMYGINEGIELKFFPEFFPCFAMFFLNECCSSRCVYCDHSVSHDWLLCSRLLLGQRCCYM